MEDMIFTGKTVQEAVDAAAKALGMDADKLVYVVVEEGKKGFLGLGAVDAQIKVSKGDDKVASAVQMLRSVAVNMGLEVTVDVKAGEDDTTVITVEGEGAGQLIGHHGETLDALQYLVNLAVNKRDADGKRDYNRITLDIENYRAKREETLRALARRMAGKVLKNKKSYMFEPMSPYERRIIHSEVQAIDGVSTNSIGVDNNRRVVLYLDETKN